jgi:hypothetical protein
MSKMHPDWRNIVSPGWSVVADVLLRQEPDEGEEEDEGDRKEDDDEDDKDDDCYSE